MVKTIDFLQADKLKKVGETAIAVSKGKRTDDEIERSIGLHSNGRQGRYYRHAAEILGLIHNHSNYSNLTPLGEEFVTLQTQAACYDFLSRCLTEAPVFQEALRYIYKYNPPHDQLLKWFQTSYPGSIKTANRRFSTFLNYLGSAEKRVQVICRLRNILATAIFNSSLGFSTHPG